MPSDFLQGIQTGATVGNLMAQRQERMMELRSQEALRHIQERQIAQEIDQRAQIFAQKQQQDQQDTADLMAAHSLYKETLDRSTAQLSEAGNLTPETFHQSQQQAQDLVDSGLSLKNPSAALKVGKAREAISKAQMEERRFTGAASFKPFVGQVEGPGGKPQFYFQGSPNNARLIGDTGDLNNEAQPVKDPNGRIIGFQVPGAKGPHFVSNGTAGIGETTSDKAEIKGIQKRIDSLSETYDAMKDTTGFGPFTKPNQEKLELKKKIDDLKAQRNQIGKTASVSDGAPKKLRYVPGQGLVPADNSTTNKSNSGE